MSVRRFILEKPNREIYAIGLYLEGITIKPIVKLTFVEENQRPFPQHMENIADCLQIPEVSTFRWLTGPNEDIDHQLWAFPENIEFPMPENLTRTELSIYLVLQKHIVVRKEVLGTELKRKPKLLAAHITHLRQKIEPFGLDIMNVGRSYILLHANLNQKRW